MVAPFIFYRTGNPQENSRKDGKWRKEDLQSLPNMFIIFSTSEDVFNSKLYIDELIGERNFLFLCFYQTPIHILRSNCVLCHLLMDWIRSYEVINMLQSIKFYKIINVIDYYNIVYTRYALLKCSAQSRLFSFKLEIISF